MELISRQVALELSLVGINVNLAPVLDVPRSPACPQWDRAYSSDPEIAARYAVAAIRGYLSGGVLPVAKHFPGLGDTLVDSHESCPWPNPGMPTGRRTCCPSGGRWPRGAHGHDRPP